MARFKKRKLSKKEESALKKSEVSDAELLDREETPRVVEVIKKKSIEVPPVVSVKHLSEILELPVTKVITALMKSGVLANINENIDLETAQIVGDDLGFEVHELSEKENDLIIPEKTVIKNKKDLTPRPPVVAVMGHVDHGKTTLLDTIQRSAVAATESGGITQHISAFQVEIPRKKDKNRTITFIDTPGHEAFSAMRAHGALITDIVVLIVAADDGVMPQTIEVIKQAKENNVPVIVAVNKIDKTDSDPLKVRKQLVDQGITPEEWGGETIFVDLSASTGKGVDKLLEAILLLSDIKNYTADNTQPATGVVIESHMHKGSGPLAIVLIENGVIKKGDAIVVGNCYGKVRILEDSKRAVLNQATASMPVRIAGLNGMPTFGDRLIVVESGKEARSQSAMATQSTQSDVVTAKKIDRDEDDDLEEAVIEFKVIIKADVKGSLEAVKQSLLKISHPRTKVTVVHEGIGNVSESEINIAKASKAIIVGFRVNLSGAAKRQAELEKITYSTFDVIYNLIDYVKLKMSERLPITFDEIETGKLSVLETFRFDRNKTIFGGMVESGELKKGDFFRLKRGQKEIYSGKIDSLRQGKEESPSVKSGSECGVAVNTMLDVIKGDQLLAYKKEEIIGKVE